jgi:hypothetical protein
MTRGRTSADFDGIKEIDDSGRKNSAHSYRLTSRRETLLNAARVKRTVVIGSAKNQRKRTQKTTRPRRIGIGEPCLIFGKTANTAAGKQNIPPINTVDKIAAVL